MKRVTTFLMALVMLLGLVGVPSNASSSSQPKIWLDRDVTLAPGESGKIDVHLEGNPGIYSLGFYIYYTDTLTISSASVNDTKDGGSTIWAQFKDEQTNKDGGYTFQDQKRVAKSDSRAVFGYVCNPPEEEDYPEVPLSSDGVIGSINVTAGDSEGDVTLVVEFTSAMGENNSKVAIETENCVVHIKNAEKKHTVTFEVNGGSAVEAQEVEAGKTATEPAKPTNGDKIFDNWYTDAEYKNVYNFSTPVTADITLYAKWNDPPTTYKVTFDSQGGSAVEAQEVEAGKTATKPANPTNGDKIFDNWYTDAECTNVYDFSAPVTVPITLYANWIEPTPYNITTKDPNGGTLSVDKTTATKGTRITVTVTLNKIEADTSYEVNVTFGGQKVKATQDKENAKKFVASFDMPASDVEVSATIEASACYIATAVYGSYDCPEVWTLRRFRDDVLGQSWYGRLFIKAYYAVSPTVLRIFGNADWFQNFWRDRLDNLVGNLQAQGFASTPYQDLEW